MRHSDEAAAIRATIQRGSSLANDRVKHASEPLHSCEACGFWLLYGHSSSGLHVPWAWIFTAWISGCHACTGAGKVTDIIGTFPAAKTGAAMPAEGPSTPPAAPLRAPGIVERVRDSLTGSMLACYAWLFGPCLTVHGAIL